MQTSTTKAPQVLLIAFLLTTLAACEKPCEPVNEQFDQSELQWFGYETGDKLVFRSDSAELDTFLVSEKRIANFGDYAGGISDAPCFVPIQGSYRIQNSDASLRALFTLTKDRRSAEGLFFSFLIRDFLVLRQQIDTLGNLTLGGIAYTDVFFAENTFAYVSKVKFNKEHGLIQYELRDQAGSWTLQEVIRR